MRWVFSGAGFPRVWFQGHGLGGPLEGLLGGDLWLLCWLGEGGGPEVGRGCTPSNSWWCLLNPLCLLTQMPVCTLGCSGPLQGIPELGAHQVLLVAWSQALWMFPFNPLVL